MQVLCASVTMLPTCAQPRLRARLIAGAALEQRVHPQLALEHAAPRFGPAKVHVRPTVDGDARHIAMAARRLLAHIDAAHLQCRAALSEKGSCEALPLLLAHVTGGQDHKGRTWCSMCSPHARCNKCILKSKAMPTSAALACASVADSASFKYGFPCIWG